jgi:RibD C-terminal domain
VLVVGGGGAIGSAELVQGLIERGLADVFRLMIDPVVLGGGKRIFRNDGSLRPLRLVDSEVTTTGRSSRRTLRPRPLVGMLGRRGESVQPSGTTRSTSRSEEADMARSRMVYRRATRADRVPR